MFGSVPPEGSTVRLPAQERKSLLPDGHASYSTACPRCGRGLFATNPKDVLLCCGVRIELELAKPA